MHGRTYITEKRNVAGGRESNFEMIYIYETVQTLHREVYFFVHTPSSFLLFDGCPMALRMLDGDALDMVFGHIGRDGRAHIALWLTCKAFSARRPTGTFATSANDMCDTPALLKWAICIGLRPHNLTPSRLTAPAALVLLKTIRPKLGAKSASYFDLEMTRFGCTIEQLFTHSEKCVRVYAKQTAVAFMKQLSNLKPAALLEPAALAEYTGFILTMLRKRHSDAMTDLASWALHKLISKLRDMAARVQVSALLSETLCHPNRTVRYSALVYMLRLRHDELAPHACDIADAVRDASVACETTTYRTLKEVYRYFQVAIRVMVELKPAVLAEFAGMFVGLLCHHKLMVREAAVDAISQLEDTALTPHKVTLLRTMGDPIWQFRESAVRALGYLSQSDLAQHTDAIAGLMKDPNASVRLHATRTMGQLPVVEKATHADTIAGLMRDDDFNVRAAAIQTLGGLDSVTLVAHAGAVARMLDDSRCFVRYAARSTLRRLPAADLAEHADAIARAQKIVQCDCRR